MELSALFEQLILKKPYIQNLSIHTIKSMQTAYKARLRFTGAEGAAKANEVLSELGGLCYNSQH